MQRGVIGSERLKAAIIGAVTVVLTVLAIWLAKVKRTFRPVLPPMVLTDFESTKRANSSLLG